MLYMMILASYEVSDHSRKKLLNPQTRGMYFFLRCLHLHIPHASRKKQFYCLNSIFIMFSSGIFQIIAVLYFYEIYVV